MDLQLATSTQITGIDLGVLAWLLLHALFLPECVVVPMCMSSCKPAVLQYWQAYQMMFVVILLLVATGTTVALAAMYVYPRMYSLCALTHAHSCSCNL